MMLRTVGRVMTVLAVASPALAYNPSEARWNPATLPIPYKVNVASIPAEVSGGGLAALNAGLATWAAPTCTNWRSTNAGSTNRSAQSNDGENTFVFINSNWPSELGDVDVVLGVTTPLWNVGAYVIDADIQYNNVGFTWSTTGGGNTTDLQSIATHEEGHFLGLDHTGSNGAVMYPTYAGGLVRNLSQDDINGVCAVYPSGGAVPDAGSNDPCARFASCGGCTPNNGCGWCPGDNTCRNGSSNAPFNGAATCGGWVWDPNDCSGGGTSSSGGGGACQYASCGACTPVDGCGWCGGSNQCVPGNNTGPVSGTCGSGWSWLPNECAGSGGGAFGEPCESPQDCASGGLCVSDGTSSLCSRSCSTDCNCPRGYSCVPTGTAGLSVCAPGNNSCVTGEPDAGSSGNTSGGTSGNTSGGTSSNTSGGTSGGTSGTDPGAGGGGDAPEEDSCTCATVPTAVGPWAFGLMAVLVLARRRRG